MILNPWKIKWEAPDKVNDTMFRVCRWSKLYMLPCKYGRVRTHLKGRPCESCFFRQEAMCTTQAKTHKIQRVCDRCGSEIPDPDHMIYAIARDRKGEYLADMELCRVCAQEYIDWIEGKDFPSNQMFDSFIDPEEL